MGSPGSPEGGKSLRQMSKDGWVHDASLRLAQGESVELGGPQLKRVNFYVRGRLRKMYIGNCVFTGEANDGKLARCSASLLRAFIGGEKDFEKIRKEIRAINARRASETGAER
jgi:hypothetical protein